MITPAGSAAPKLSGRALGCTIGALSAITAAVFGVTSTGSYAGVIGEGIGNPALTAWMSNTAQVRCFARAFAPSKDTKCGLSADLSSDLGTCYLPLRRSLGPQDLHAFRPRPWRPRRHRYCNLASSSSCPPRYARTSSFSRGPTDALLCQAPFSPDSASAFKVYMLRSSRKCYRARYDLSLRRSSTSRLPRAA